MIKHKIVKRKPYLQILEDECPNCGYRLAIWARRSDGEQFVGCSKYPQCKYTEYKTLIDYIRDDLKIPLTWRPKKSGVIETVFQNCQSRTEKQYLLGAIYFIDATKDGKSGNADINIGNIFYQETFYNGLIVNRMFEHWKMGGYSPTSLAIAPQIRFGNKLHHDFGIFCSSEKYPKENDLYLECGIEIDYHPSHEWNPDADKFRDSLVKYKVLRIKPEESPLTWFRLFESIYNQNAEEAMERANSNN
jgi:ssDNA-binding Zn-finger/Zn-ribbon topoisomerase 1